MRHSAIPSRPAPRVLAPVLSVALAIAAAGQLAACSDRPAELERSAIGLPASPDQTGPDWCDRADRDGQATHDVVSRERAEALCERSSATCTVCPQSDGSGRYSVYEYQGSDCDCRPEPASPVPVPPPPPPTPTPAPATCGEAGSAAGQATYDVANSRDAAGICAGSSDSCTVCYQPDGSGRLVVYQYLDITCACAAGTELIEERPLPEPTPEPTPEPVPVCGEAQDIGHATYDLADEASAHDVCNSTDEVCTICDQADNSGRFAVYQYQSTRCACPPQPPLP